MYINHFNVSDVLLRFQGTLIIEYESQKNNYWNINRKNITVYNDDVIQNNWELYREKHLNAKQFVWKVAEELRHGKYADEVEQVDEGTNL